MKKWLTGLFFLLAMFVVTTNLASGIVFAETQSPIEIKLNDDYFNPDVITILKGKTTTLVLKNVGSKEHTFTVKKLGIDEEVQPGKEKSINVSPKMSGTYELICRYHLNNGMVGKLIVK